ncbi:MAG: low molecular weight phosphatase family protein [Chloroflexi bacterium HGW-Chloroflexi-8]|nr:MAG: low molecular weight phosphatase family protein [Chloroflexi bacterium HGW-Chloroflexi-8]
MRKQKILFLCTGNSCRSQMAEAIVNTTMSDHWIAMSAGTQPTGIVHPLVIKVLDEIGIAHHGRSKSVEEFHSESFDLVVTVCDDAEENCPIWLGKGKRIHLGFPDPAKALGTENEKLIIFRSIRDDMLKKITDLLANPNS